MHRPQGAVPSRELLGWGARRYPAGMYHALIVRIGRWHVNRHVSSLTLLGWHSVYLGQQFSGGCHLPREPGELTSEFLQLLIGFVLLRGLFCKVTCIHVGTNETDNRLD